MVCLPGHAVPQGARHRVRLPLGSGGAILLPDQTDEGGAVRHLLVGAGKDGNIYLVDRDNMGKFAAGASSNTNIYQELTGALLPEGAYSTPAFFNGVLYYGAAYSVLKAFPLSNAKLAAAPSSKTSDTFN